jgi:hypothetical protein
LKREQPADGLEYLYLVNVLSRATQNVLPLTDAEILPEAAHSLRYFLTYSLFAFSSLSLSR